MHQYTDFAPDLTITKKPLHSHCAVILGVSTNATSGQDSGTFSQLTSFANPNEEICRMIENSIKNESYALEDGLCSEKYWRAASKYAQCAC